MCISAISHMEQLFSFVYQETKTVCVFQVISWGCHGDNLMCPLGFYVDPDSHWSVVLNVLGP